ncbi:BRCT domain-containing protein [Cynara cardunculus var. scolymus]|uniref:BRCT domain-containing protein n=1 Tax=Cynara cardunculus var. scolymus TaxID=59895 RepID=A0A124SIE7_CYNCS|nr:BRCT domain-containing protein [Cynara cardunculus var. scolymus]
MENTQSSPFGRPSQVFHGIRFLLLGFDPLKKPEVLRKLVNGGGVDASQYGPNCTHVIVDKLTYDDPICVAARRDGKILVSGLWVDHSFDVGVPVDTTSVMYKPVRDLNGITGAKSLVICLTGYQREDREDIMTMVELMGAHFSKPLIANRVTHLICYKFEGEKYLLAKKMKRIKLINHRWLEDCGYELEMEAEAKDSEEEAEGFATRHHEGKMASPHHSLMLKQEVTRSQSNTSASKRLGNAADMVSMTMKSTSDQFPNAREIKSNHPLVLGFSNTENVIGVTGEPSKVFEGTASGSAAQNETDAASIAANKSPLDEAGKVISASYSRKVPRMTSAEIDITSNKGSAKKLGKLNLSEAFNTSSSLVEKVNDGSETVLAGIRTPSNGPAVCLGGEQYGSSTGKRKMDVACGSSKLQRMSQNDGTPNRESTHVDSAFQELKKHSQAEMSNHLSSEADIPYLNDRAAASPAGIPPSNITGRKSSSSKGKSVTCDVPIYKTSAPELGQGENLDEVRRPLKESSEPSSVTKFNDRDADMVRLECAMPGAQKLEHVMQRLEESSPSAVRSDLEKSSTPYLEINELGAGSNSKPVKRKSVGKKLSAPNQNPGTKKTVNQKGSIYLKNSEPKNNAKTSTVGVQGLADNENLLKYQMFERAPLAAKSGPEMGMNGDLQIQNMSGNKSSYIDDETEPPEDKEEAGKEKHEGVEPEKTVDIDEKAKEDLHDIDENNDKDADTTDCENVMPIRDKVLVEKSDDTKNPVNDKTSKGRKLPLTKKAKKRTALSVKEVTDRKAAKKKELASDNDNEKAKVREEATPLRTVKTKRKVNDLENFVEVERAEGGLNDPEHMSEEKHDNGTEHANSPSNMDDVQAGKHADTENVVNKKAAKKNKCPPSKTRKDVALSVKEVTDSKAVSKKGKPTSSRTVKTCDMEAQKENRLIPVDQSTCISNRQVLKSATELPEKINPKPDQAKSDPMAGSLSRAEPMWFILSGHKLQRREFQQIIRRLKGRVCRVSHQWSYQATHFIVPDPMRRTEKFFAAAASGRWILKTDYLSASNEAGKFLAEEPYEWHRNGLSEDGQINLEAPRKWRLLKEKTGHGAFYGMRIIIYGECISPPLDTLKRAVKAGDGTILATSPPYTRFLNSGIDFAIVSPGMPHVDIWVQEFLRHEIPCISADYLVEYVCKPGFPLERHVQYDTDAWAERSYNNLKNRLREEMNEARTPESNDVACEVCGLRDRGEEMLICGNESGSSGCGGGTHIDCCDPPLEDVPEEDWFCPRCRKSSTSNKKKSSKRKGK